MYDPKTRFFIVVTCLLVAAWLFLVMMGPLLGTVPFHFDRYIHNAILVGLGVWFGYGFVYLGVKFLNLKNNTSKAFTPKEYDHTGTTFNMPVNLTRFVPAIIAPPAPDEHITPLESELIGFLNSLGDWPLSLTADSPTLQDYTLKLYHIVQNAPNITPLQRIAALASHLSVVYAFKEHRKSVPWHQFWRREASSYSLRRQPHGSLSTVMLSQMPSFKSQLTAEEQRALLTALRYVHQPEAIPRNVAPVTRDIINTLARAEAQMMQGAQPVKVDVTVNNNVPLATEDAAQPLPQQPSQQDIEALERDLLTTLASLLGHLLSQKALASTLDEAKTAMVFKPDAHTLALQIDAVLLAVLDKLNPHLRTALDLWDDATALDKLKPLFYKALTRLDALSASWQGQPIPPVGLQLQAADSTTLPPVFMVDLDSPNFAKILQENSQLLQDAPTLMAPLDAVLSPELLHLEQIDFIQSLENSLQALLPLAQNLVRVR